MASMQLEFKINDFEGPLDLLFHLIEKNDIDIYDIPIAQITDQYMSAITDIQSLDMEVASSFLVMAATLIHIKSRMLLPGKKSTLLEGEEEDPREELVVRLLQYRRCKLVAGELKERYAIYSNSIIRLPAAPKALGIQSEPPVQIIKKRQFYDAVSTVCVRNELRFADIGVKISHILKRDKSSVREKMKSLWSAVIKKTKVFFHEIFSLEDSTKIEKITGFLAVLELLRRNRVFAYQEKPFDSILLEKNPEMDDADAEDYFMPEKEENLYD